MSNNREMAEKDTFFRQCCDAANVKPTKRQASKFLNKKGSAYKSRNKVNRTQTQEVTS